MSDADKPETFDFDFAPDWARKSADEYVSRYRDRSYDERTGREERPRRDDAPFRRPRREDGESGRPQRSGRPPRREGDRGDFRPPRRREGGAAPDESRPRPDARPPRADRPPRRDGDFGPRPPRREYVKPLEAEIRILPNQKNLGIIISKIQASHLAYPVKRFVNLFLENPQACLVRLEVPQESEVRFHSCKRCGFVALSEEEVVRHALEAHLGDIFETSEEACEPPSGVFPRVAKCTLSGEWIGAPNHHNYRRRVEELAARAGMAERDYLRTVEMHTDAESIEAWKQSVTTQTVYRLKAEPTPATEGEAPAEAKREAYNRDQAEAVFRRDHLPAMLAVDRHVCLPLSLAQRSPSLPLVFLLRSTLREEHRHPRSLFYALRGAFRHHRFTLFRATDERGPEFVANVTPTPFKAENMVAELKAALAYVTEHPLCTRGELLAALKAELPEVDPSVILRQVAFLLQKGHIIEYYNSVLALPETNPRFRKLPEEMQRERSENAETPPKAEPADSTSTPKEPAAEPTESTSAPEAMPEVAPAEPQAEADKPVETSAPEATPETAPAEQPAKDAAPIEQPAPEAMSEAAPPSESQPVEESSHEAE